MRLNSRSSKHEMRAICLSVALGLALSPCWAAVGPGSPFQKFKLVDKNSLAKQRGGFVGAEGLRLQISLNLRQMVYVNEQLVSDIRIDIANIHAATTAQVNQLREDIQAQADAIRAETRALATQLEGLADPASNGQSAQAAGSASGVSNSAVMSTSAQPLQAQAAPTKLAGSTSGIGNTEVASTSAPSQQTHAAPALAQTQATTSPPPAASTRQEALAAASAGAASSSPGGLSTSNPLVTATSVPSSANSPNSTPGSHVLVVQNGPRNVVDTSSLQNFRGGALTVIQNTLNNQAIRNVMTLDVTIAGLRNLRTLESLGSLNLQLRGIGR